MTRTGLGDLGGCPVMRRQAFRNLGRAPGRGAGGLGARGGGGLGEPLNLGDAARDLGTREFPHIPQGSRRRGVI